MIHICTGTLITTNCILQWLFLSYTTFVFQLFWQLLIHFCWSERNYDRWNNRGFLFKPGGKLRSKRRGSTLNLPDNWLPSLETSLWSTTHASYLALALNSKVCITVLQTFVTCQEFIRKLLSKMIMMYPAFSIGLKMKASLRGSVTFSGKCQGNFNGH